MVNNKPLKPKDLGLKPHYTNLKNCNDCNTCAAMVTKNLCKKTQIIYKITCKVCESFYIGRTMRTLEQRYNEHLKDWQNGKNKSAIGYHMITEHALTTIKHNLLKLEILDHCKDTVDNILKEIYHIDKLNPQLNRKHENTNQYHK